MCHGMSSPRLPWWLKWWSICLQCRRPGFSPWVGKISWRRKWQPTLVFFPEISHGWRSLVGYSPWGCKELDTTEMTSLSLSFFHGMSMLSFHIICLSDSVALDTGIQQWVKSTTSPGTWRSYFLWKEITETSHTAFPKEWDQKTWS